MGKIFSRENRQLVLVIIIVVGAVALSRMLSSTKTLPDQKPESVQLPVTVVTLESAAHRLPIRSTGRVIPRGTVSITPQVSGRVEWVSDNLYSGGYLEKNQSLFRIEAADYENNVARDQAEVAKAETDLALERAEANAAIAEWQALNENIVLPALVSREPQIAQAEAELAAAQARLAQAELNLSRTQYRLPFAGRVISSSLEAGEYVLAGQSYGEIYNQDSLEVVLSLPQANLHWLRSAKSLSSSGDEIAAREFSEIAVQIVFQAPGEASGELSISGEILRLGAVLNDTTRFQEVVIKPIGDGQLLPGMLTDVVLNSAPIADTWKLPTTAIQVGEFVWRVDDDLTLHRLEPEIIATLSDGVIVRLPLSSSNGRFVDSAVAGAVEGAMVVIIDDQVGEQ
ncbi:MAG: efflux RND transporter periplasmic adaptor subunit [Porticoccaceae bacterium]|nr:efflux RND transporter periplasmic adaptor subunit [Porticoccaceae bacterium]